MGRQGRRQTDKDQMAPFQAKLEAFESLERKLNLLCGSETSARRITLENCVAYFRERGVECKITEWSVAFSFCDGAAPYHMRRPRFTNASKKCWDEFLDLSEYVASNIIRERLMSTKDLTEKRKRLEPFLEDNFLGSKAKHELNMLGSKRQRKH